MNSSIILRLLFHEHHGGELELTQGWMDSIIRTGRFLNSTEKKFEK